MRRAARLAAVLAILPVHHASAQEQPPIVGSTVVVDEVTVEDGLVPEPDSGLTVAPVLETSEEAIRADAEDLQRTRQVRRLQPPIQPAHTLAVTRNVVSEQRSKNASSCVQVGVIGARRACRPPRR